WSSFGRARTTSPRSTTARSSILGQWYAGSGGRRTATDAGSGNRPLRGALRVRGATIVLARTASGELQPSASLAACVAAAIRSGAGVIFSAGFASAAFASAGAGAADGATGASAAVDAGAAADAPAGCLGNGRNSAVSSSRPCTRPTTPDAEPSSM